MQRAEAKEQGGKGQACVRGVRGVEGHLRAKYAFVFSVNRA